MIDIARWLWQDADPGRWTRDDLATMCAARGWTLDGDDVRTGLPTGDGVLRKSPSDDAYISISLPLSGPHADAATAGREFRRAGITLCKELGESTIMGHSIVLDDWFEPRSPWGAPFRQWRSADRLLDLRFEDRHVAIALQPREVVEQRRYEAFTSTTPHHVSGFFLTRRDIDITLKLPGGWLVDDWELLRGQLARLLADLPTTSAALGTTISFRLFLTTPVGKTAWVDVLSRDRLLVYGTFDLLADPAALGWQPNADEPDEAFGWRPFELGRHPEWIAPDGLDGPALADLIVGSALAAGITEADKAAIEFLCYPPGHHPRMYGLSIGE